MKKRVLLRLLVGLGAPALGIAVCVLLIRGKIYIPCAFFSLTGLYCPGCGSGRALLALLRGRPGEAFSHNALCFILGIPALLLLCYEYLRFVFPRLGLREIPLPPKTAVFCLFLVLAFAVLRNLPFFSFLAP